MAPPAPDLPDDERTFALLQVYLEELHAGRQPDHERWISEHPELAGWLSCLDSVDRLALPPAVSSASASTLTQAPSASTVFTLASNGSTQFGKYELLNELGRGGMGVVYKARQLDLDRIVAVKMILASHLATHEQIARFQSEAKAAARLRHPHIVQIHEAGEINQQPYFAMEYLDGPSLAHRLQRGPLPLDEAVELLATVARAVQHLHANGIIHRDLKPSNIVLCEDKAESRCIPKITDFGVAKVADAQDDLTASGTIVGTPSYMSPEQAAGHHQQVDRRSDVYSLGAILYELITGRPPFREATPVETILQVLQGEPPLPRRVNPEVPRNLEIICLRALEKSPEHRYPTAAALADDLQRYLQGEPVEAVEYDWAQRLVRWGRREPALVARAFTVAVFLVISQLAYHLAPMVPLAVHLRVLGILLTVAAVAVACQRLLSREVWPDRVRAVWILCDVTLTTLLLATIESQVGPLAVVYPLLIAAAGLWYRVRLVTFTTLISMAAYCWLIFVDPPGGTAVLYPHHHLVFLVGLAVVGYVVGSQVRRVRALNRYYERRPVA